MPFSELAPFVAAAIRDSVVEQLQKENELLKTLKRENFLLKQQDKVELKYKGEIVATRVMRGPNIFHKQADGLGYVVEVRACVWEYQPGLVGDERTLRSSLWKELAELRLDNDGNPVDDGPHPLQEGQIELTVDGKRVDMGEGRLLLRTEVAPPAARMYGYGDFSHVPLEMHQTAQGLAAAAATDLSERSEVLLSDYPPVINRMTRMQLVCPVNFTVLGVQHPTNPSVTRITEVMLTLVDIKEE